MGAFLKDVITLLLPSGRRTKLAFFEPGRIVEVASMHGESLLLSLGV